MAKIQPSAKTRKLTEAGFSCCADSLAPSHPQLSAIFRDKARVDQLELLIKTHGTLGLLEKLEQLVTKKLFSSSSFDDIDTVRVSSEREKKADAILAEMNPVGTADWLFEVFPFSKGLFCQLVVEAEDMEATIRELTANYNYVGIEAEAIPEILNRSNDFCKLLRSLATIQEKRKRAIAQAGASKLACQLMPEEVQPAA